MKVLRNKVLIEVEEFKSGDIFVEQHEDLPEEVKDYMLHYTNLIQDMDTKDKFVFSNLFYRVDEYGNFHRINTSFLPENIRKCIKEDLQYFLDRF